MMLLTVFIMMVFVSETEGNGEALEFHLYTAENVSVKIEPVLETWEDSRRLCQDTGGDLSQMFTLDKDFFLREKRDTFYGRDNYLWLGMSDIDMDGMYEYINGSTLKTKDPGMGKWRDNKPPNPLLRQKKLCIAMDKDDGWLISLECSMKIMSFCEKPPSQIGVKDAKDGCTMEKCNCKREEWIYYEARKIYFKVNRVARNFTTSALLCRKLGGQLLKVPDEPTETFIRNLPVSWDPMGVRYWIGITKQSSSWIWIDGKKLLPSDYANWFMTTMSREECAAAIWDYWGKWRGTNCSQKHYQVCQTSSVPCTAHPMLTIDGKVQTNNGNVQKTNAGESSVKCHIQGYEDVVIEVNVACNVGSNNLESHARVAERTIHIDITMHGKACVCQLRFIDGTTEKTTAVINFKTRPCLVEEKSDNKTFYKTTGEKAVLHFKIYANPRPMVFELSETGNQIDPSEYNVTLQPLDKPLYYKVTLKFMNKLSSKMKGTYTLEIDNGVKENLEYVFTLKLRPKDPEPWMNFNIVYLLVVAIIVIPHFVVFVIKMISMRKERQKQKLNEGIPEQEAEIFAFPSNEEYVDNNVVTDEDAANRQTTRHGHYQSTAIF